MSGTYLNGEVTALKDARAKAQETINRLDKALAILEGSGTNVAPLVAGAVLSGRAGKAVAEYHRGWKATVIAKRYGVSPVTLYAWLKKAGVPTHAAASK